MSIPVTRRDVNLSPHIRQVDQCFMFNVRLVDLVSISFKLVSVWDLELGRRLSTFLCLQETLGAACFCGVGSFFLASVVLVYLCDRLLLPATSSRRGYSPPPLICSSRSSRGRCGTPTPCIALTPPLTPYFLSEGAVFSLVAVCKWELSGAPATAGTPGPTVVQARFLVLNLSCLCPPLVLTRLLEGSMCVRAPVRDIRSAWGSTERFSISSYRCACLQLCRPGGFDGDSVDVGGREFFCAGRERSRLLGQ